MALALAALMVAVPSDAASKRKKKKGEAEKVETPKKPTEYEKLFKDKKVETAESFMKVHLLDRKTYIVELPKTMTGRDILLTSAVDRTSNGGDAGTGFRSMKSVHIVFEKIDSMIVLKEVDSYAYSSDAESSASSVKNSHIGAVVGKFPIKAMSPDSSAYVFDMTKYLTTYDKRLDPSDPDGADSFGGMLSANLSHKSELSMPYGLEAYEDNMAILSYETYGCTRSFGALTSSDGENNLSVVLRRNFMLLSEKPASMRIADARIGVNPVVRVNYTSDEGSEYKWFAQRWDLSDGKKIRFYVDTLFTAEVAKAVTDGILKWNDAFEAMGKGKVIEVLPYPSDDPDFNPNDLRYSCVRQEVIASEKLRSHLWTDPRSGEILSCSITVPIDVLLGLHTEMLMSVGDAAPELRTVRHDVPVVFEGLQAKITREVGKCLGLGDNYAASSAVPADSLRSATYTSRYGISGSVMDMLPYNFFVKPGDREKGVCLVQTNIGEYDKYAVNWLYCDVAGAVTPDEEKPYLDNLIASSASNPLCKYIRRPSRMDARYMWEPRCVADDLGDDPFRSVTERIAKLKYMMADLDTWVDKEDYDYTFRPYLNTHVVGGVLYPVLDIMKYVGGIYMNDKRDGDVFPSYQVVDKDMQKKALTFALDQISNMQWLDECQAWRDIIFVRSFADYLHTLLLGELPVVFHKLALSEQKDKDTYTVMDAYDDIIDHILKDVKAGKKSAMNNLLMQYFILGQVMNTSNINPRLQDGRGIQAIREAQMYAYQLDPEAWEERSFQTMSGYSFGYTSEHDYRIYRKLLEMKSVYERAARTVNDKSLRQQYEYFVMALDRALKID